jgi:hypothetical protein
MSVLAKAKTNPTTELSEESMTQVSVDLEDLERIVFAAAAIKSIENTLEARKRDPFMRTHLDFTAAHNRLTSAMRNATRAQADTLVKWDEPLEKDEIDQLKIIDAYLEATDDDRQLPFYIISVKDKLPPKDMQMSLIDRLAAKGCVIIGRFSTGVVWPGEDRPELSIDPKGFAVKITDRGRNKLGEV